MRQNLLLICVVCFLLSNCVTSASNQINAIQTTVKPEEPNVSSTPEQTKQQSAFEIQTEKDKAKYKDSPDVYVGDCCPHPIGSIVMNGRAKNLVQPEYPEAARKTHASGQVSVQVLIDEKGKVVSATAVSGNPLLRPSAYEAAKKLTFNRFYTCGKFVKVSGTIIYNFTAQ